MTEGAKGPNTTGDHGPGDILERLRGPHSPDVLQAVPEAIAEIERLRRQVIESRELVARWMMGHSYATGHGDTVEDLLVELEGQAMDRAWSKSSS